MLLQAWQPAGNWTVGTELLALRLSIWALLHTEMYEYIYSLTGPLFYSIRKLLKILSSHDQ